MPLRCNMLLRFYNRTHYNKAGLPEPTPAQTWLEFRAQAPKLVQDVKGTGGVNAWAISTYFTRDSLTPTIWQAILSSYGAELIDLQGKPGFNNAAGNTALQTHIDLLQWAPPGAKAHGFTESLQAFRQGQTANMFQWGSVYKGTAVDPNTTTLKPEEVGIMVMPVGNPASGAGRPGTHRGIWNGCVSKKSPNQQAAWAMLQWLSSKDGEFFHFKALPEELEEAAKIDGCTRFGAFFRIIVPISLPGLLSTLIFSIILAWEELLFALVLTNRAASTVPVVISGIAGDTVNGANWGALTAVGTMTVIPVVIFALLVQKWLIQGLADGATKG